MDWWVGRYKVQPLEWPWSLSRRKKPRCDSHWGKSSREDKQWEDTNVTETKVFERCFFCEKGMVPATENGWFVDFFNDCTSPLFACFSLGFLVNPWPEKTVSPKILLRNIDSSSKSKTVSFDDPKRNRRLKRAEYLDLLRICKKRCAFSVAFVVSAG